jgi:hypothetical protein
MLDLEFSTKEVVSRRDLDDASKLEDSQEENNYRRENSLPAGVTAAIIAGTVVITICIIIFIFITMKIIINYQWKARVEKNLKRYKEQFNIRTGKFNIVTEEIKYEQTDCAICLCEFGTELDCRVIKACQHVFHSE